MSVPDRSRVIIVEDDASMCQALQRILRLGGFTSVTYESGEALLESDGAAEAACLIIDVQLPGMSGFTLYRRLAHSGRVAPIVFITAFDEAEARVQASRIERSTFLAKPFPGRLLLSTIRRLLEAPLPHKAIDA